MSAHALSSRRLPAFAVAAVCIAALGAAFSGAHERQPASPARPAADAPVDVVRAPASTAPQAPACVTCAMGAGRVML